MSRSIALADLDQELQEIVNLQEQIVQDYQSYHNDVSEAIKQTLEGAGVWEAIHELELERESVRKKGEEKLQILRQKQQEALKIREWILKRSPESAPPEEIPHVEEEAGSPEEPMKEAVEAPVGPPVEVVISESKAPTSSPNSGQKKKPAPPSF